MRKTSGPIVQKFCKDCKWIDVKDGKYDAATCTNARFRFDKRNLVSGAVEIQAPFLCSIARAQTKLCGHTGRHFLAKDG